MTWTVTPLLTGNGLPLRVMAESGDYWGIAEQPIVVKEPDAPLPLTLDGLCGPGTVRPGMPISISAYVLDETLHPLTDTLTAVTATVYAIPTLAYSATFSLIPDTEGFFKQTLNLPEDAPIGTYWVDFTATRPGYAPAYGASAFFVAPPLTMTLTATPTVLVTTDVLTITAQVYERGTAVRGASVGAEIRTPNGQVVLPVSAPCPAQLPVAGLGRGGPMAHPGPFPFHRPAGGGFQISFSSLASKKPDFMKSG